MRWNQLSSFDAWIVEGDVIVTTAETAEEPLPAPVKVIDTQGRLPEFWHRDVTFFANLLSLFFGNEGGAATLRREVGEIDSYGGRLVPIMNLLFKNSNNLLVIPRAPDGSLCVYFRDSLGLTLPEMHVMTREAFLMLGLGGKTSTTVNGAETLSSHSSRWIDGFVTDATLERIANSFDKQTITTESGSRHGNNKLLLHQFLASNGLPVVDTCIAETEADVDRCARELARRGFRSAVIKAQVGASGIGMLKLEDIGQPVQSEDVPSYLFHEGPCLVQGWLEPGRGGVLEIHSPSVQIFVSDASVYLYDVTEQILSETSVHEGNESPPAYLRHSRGLREEIFEQAGAAARWLHGIGYRGTASADFLVVRFESREFPEVYVCELNARVTGATYPSVLARHFMPDGAWLHRNLRLRKPLPGKVLLARFGQRDHLYSPGKERGVLPVNFNFDPDGLVNKGQFLCLAESREECSGYLELAQADTDVEWAFDRD
jgi:hypothetical protein